MKMEESFLFLNLDGLDDGQIKQIHDLLHPSNLGPGIEFPWYEASEKIATKGSSLNVHAPEFDAYSFSTVNPVVASSLYSYGSNQKVLAVSFSKDAHYYPSADKTVASNFTNGNLNSQYSDKSQACNGNIYPMRPAVSNFKLNPTVSSFIPQNIKIYSSSNSPSNEPVAHSLQVEIASKDIKPAVSLDINDNVELVSNKHADANNAADKLVAANSAILVDAPSPKAKDSFVVKEPLTEIKEPVADAVKKPTDSVVKKDTVVKDVTKISELKSPAPVASRRSWADIVSHGQKPARTVVSQAPESNVPCETVDKVQEVEIASLNEDFMALTLGKQLHSVELDFKPVFLQPRGLINRRNWCYVNATLQALLACPPFYVLIKNLPIKPEVNRGKSCTPVIDSIVKFVAEYLEYDATQEDLQLGAPFQPDFIYDMLRDMKSDCLKGQQEDAEEFLSFILNNMHEEMVKLIKNYEKQNHLVVNPEVQENGDMSDGEEEWQVMGSKHKGMVTRKVAEHKTPISDLLGGQIKSFLTASGNKTSASVQPFFTLQLDIQSDNVTSVSEALKEMAVKEPIQGYTCAKTKQEVEAYSHISLQKLPPVLILHLKRFVYNKNGGCKKVMKKTDYPIELELNKDMFSPDVKRVMRNRVYKLFAVMYHDGEEAIKGHYVCDIYNHGCQTWIRCDDRIITAVTETDVLSHSPPRVPYLLFYQDS